MKIQNNIIPNYLSRLMITIYIESKKNNRHRKY